MIRTESASLYLKTLARLMEAGCDPLPKGNGFADAICPACRHPFRTLVVGHTSDGFAYGCLGGCSEAQIKAAVEAAINTREQAA